MLTTLKKVSKHLRGWGNCRWTTDNWKLASIDRIKWHS